MANKEDEQSLPPIVVRVCAKCDSGFHTAEWHDHPPQMPAVKKFTDEEVLMLLWPSRTPVENARECIEVGRSLEEEAHKQTRRLLELHTADLEVVRQTLLEALDLEDEDQTMRALLERVSYIYIDAQGEVKKLHEELATAKVRISNVENINANLSARLSAVQGEPQLITAPVDPTVGATIGDLEYLKTLRNAGGFTPVGWIYLNLFSNMADRGLLSMTANGTFHVTQYGLEELERLEKEAKEKKDAT